MASSTKTAGTITQSSTTKADWSNLTNIGASDNAFASSASSAPAYYPEIIYATNFGFTIPAGATVTGIEVNVERKTSTLLGGGRPFTSIYLRYNGSNISAYKLGSQWTTSDVTETFGGSSEMWGQTSASLMSQVNSSLFGITIEVIANGITDLYIDYVTLTVHYTCALVTVDTVTLDDGIETEAYSETLASTPTGLTWSLESGALPDGLALTTASGIISGTPTVVNTFTFTVRATSDCDADYDEKELSIIINDLNENAVTETVASVTETIALTTSTFDVSMANNNQAYILNRKTGYWTFQDTAPFTSALYRPSTQKILAGRRDLGQITSFEGSDFAGVDIDSIIQTGYMNLGEFDEIKAMEDKSSEAIKRLRAFFADCKGEGNLTLTIYTENDSTGETFTLTLATTDNDTLNAIRTALSRSLHGKYIAFKLTNASGNDFWIGETRMKILPKAIR